MIGRSPRSVAKSGAGVGRSSSLRSDEGARSWTKLGILHRRSVTLCGTAPVLWWHNAPLAREQYTGTERVLRWCECSTKAASAQGQHGTNTAATQEQDPPNPILASEIPEDPRSLDCAPSPGSSPGGPLESCPPEAIPRQGSQARRKRQEGRQERSAADARTTHSGAHSGTHTSSALTEASCDGERAKVATVQSTPATPMPSFDFRGRRAVKSRSARPPKRRSKLMQRDQGENAHERREPQQSG